MKTLTDYFQSLELMKVGVPKETADYYFRKDCVYNSDHKRQEPCFPYVPCWSIGALWEYLHSISDKEWSFETSLSSEELVEALVDAVCSASIG